jgi:hypothetical protein
MAHALRLNELGFPNPDAWPELADGVLDPSKLAGQFPAARISRYAATPSAKRSPELAHFLVPTVETG